MALSFEQFQALRKEGLSAQQIANFEAGYIPKIKKKETEEERRKSFLIGFGKGLVKTTRGVGSLVERFSPFAPAIAVAKAGARAVLPESTGKKFGLTKDRTISESLIPEAITQAKEGLEKVGFGLEQVGELFIPIPGLRATKLAQVGKTKAIITEGAEFAGRIAAQTGGDVEETMKAGALGLTSGVLGKFVLEPAFKFVAPALANYLEKVNLRLTPTQKSKIKDSGDRVTKFLADKKIVGSPDTRLNKVDDLYNKAEDTLQRFLKTKGKETFVNKEKLIEQVNGIKMKYGNTRDVVAAEKQIDDFIELLSTRYADDIPVETLNTLKRSTYGSAYNRAGDKVLDGVEHDLADALRINIEKATEGLTVNGKTIGAFNKEFGNIIESKKLLKIATGRKQVGLVGKLLAMSVGASIGGAGGGIGSALGIVAAQPIANTIAGTATRSLIEAGLINISKFPADKVTETVLKALLPFIRQKDQKKNSEAVD